MRFTAALIDASSSDKPDCAKGGARLSRQAAWAPACHSFRGDLPHELLLRRGVTRRRQDRLGERMAHNMSEAVGTALKRVAVDRRRLLCREQARRYEGAPNDFHLLIRRARLLSLSHELLGGGIARQ